MTWEQLFSDIKAGDIKNVYCFYGAEEYVKRSALFALRKKLLPEGLEDFNHTVFEGAPVRDIIEAAEMLPVMSDRRLVEVMDWGPLMSGRSKNEATETDALLEWLPNAPDTATVVFYLRGAPDGRKKAMQQIHKGAAAVAFDPLPDDKLQLWVKAQLKPAGKQLAPKALNELIFRAGRDMTRLAGELQKLTAYAGERHEIEVSDVIKLVTPSLESSVFQLIDQLIDRNLAGAHVLYSSILESGENRVGILFMITRQLRILLHIKLLSGAGLPLTEAEKRLSIPRFSAQRSEAQARKYSVDGLKAGYQACLDCEFAIKSGKVRDSLAVDQLLIALGRMH